MSKELLIFPEDSATRDLIIGFKQSGCLNDAKVHLGSPGEGKFSTIRQLATWIPRLRSYPNRKVLFVLDSDSEKGTVTNIWKCISEVIDETLSPCFRDALPERVTSEKQSLMNRVFLFSWAREVEDLKLSAIGQGNMSRLGQTLASDIGANSCDGVWKNAAFQSTMFSVGPSGKTECERIREALFPLLFSHT